MMSGLMNFLNPRFKPTVETDACCEDGFTAANLIATDAEQLNLGFKCLPTCKPPVEIIFNFPKTVDMKVIKLWPSMRALRSTSFELYGRQNDGWERVAFIKDVPHGADSVTFCHQSEYNSQSSSNVNAADSFTWQPQTEKVFFLKTAQKLLATTNGIKVIIRATEECVPVLRKAEMWGLPARTLEKADKDLLTSMWSEISDSYGQGSGPSLGSSLLFEPPSPPRVAYQLREQSTLSVPEDFLDCITWELMTVPTVLPSGKVVDQSTVKKHAAAEAKWGRLPSDPFTSLEFNEQRKTRVDVELQKRIEEFRMEHPEDFEEVPQSSGFVGVNRFCPFMMSRASSGFDTFSDGPFGRNHLGPLVKGSVTPDLGASSAQGIGYKRKITGISASSACGATAAVPSSPPPKRTKFSHPGTALDDGPSTSTSSSAQRLAMNQEALHLFGCSGSMTPLLRCISCRSNQYRYKLRTCNHYVCVYCLVQLQREYCCVCKVSFKDNDVEPFARDR